MFANAEVQIAPPLGLKLSGAFERQERFGGRSQIRGASHQPGDFLGNGIENLSGSGPAGHALGVRGEFRQVPVPTFGQLPALHFRELIREFGILFLVRTKHGCPGVPFGLPSGSDTGSEMVQDFLGHQKFRVFRPSIGFLRQANFIFAQGFAVRAMRILFIRRSECDVTVNNNETRRFGFVLERLERPRQRFQIIGVLDA